VQTLGKELVTLRDKAMPDKAGSVELDGFPIILRYCKWLFIVSNNDR